jgi:nucleoside-diphosphate-sugar epimerase
MNPTLPGIVLTGASGFVGRNFIETANKKFRLYCIARRSQNEAGIPRYDNIKWAQADIGNLSRIQDIAKSIKDQGGADYVLHLAGFYDFTLKDNPAYENTNVTGTDNILKLAQYLEIKRFLFSSSLVVSKFSEPDRVLDEKSPPDAEFPYARSKRKGEELVKEYSRYFSCSIIRLAAVFSDWCEYAPLYVFLNTWLSNKWNSKILGGRGESSITYIHINDLIKLLLKIIEISDTLPKLDTYVASPGGTITHNELFKAATKYYYGHIVRPFRFPKWLAFTGTIVRSFSGRIFGNEPFERLWMIKYIDKKLLVEPSVTNKNLLWKTTQRYDILRRLLFMIDKIKNHHNDWKIKNEITLRRIAYRPNILIYDILVKKRESLVNKMLQHILSPENKIRFRHYRKMDENTLKWHITLLYQLIAITIRTKDRQLIQNYSFIITYRRFLEEFDIEELVEFSNTLVNIINSTILSRSELKEMKQEVFDYINVTMQLTVDEIEDYYEFLETQPLDALSGTEKLPSIENSEDIKRIVRQLEDTFYDTLDYHLKKDYQEMRSFGFSVNR